LGGAGLERAGLTHEIFTLPKVNHALFNDTGARCDPASAGEIYQRLVDWFRRHLAWPDGNLRPRQHQGDMPAGTLGAIERDRAGVRWSGRLAKPNLGPVVLALRCGSADRYGDRAGG
jgi:hypothetical protein